MRDMSNLIQNLTYNLSYILNSDKRYAYGVILENGNIEEKGANLPKLYLRILKTAADA